MATSGEENFCQSTAMTYDVGLPFASVMAMNLPLGVRVPAKRSGNAAMASASDITCTGAENLLPPRSNACTQLFTTSRTPFGSAP